MQHLTISTSRDPADPTDFLVIVEDEEHHQLAQLDAFSGAHAHRVAADMMLLIRKMDPKLLVVLDGPVLRPSA